MQQQFLNHIETTQLFVPGDRILLAVSGGLDSMVMLRLFYEAAFQIGVVHCNFQLRGEESRKDEDFVRESCEALAIPFYCKRMSTAEFAEETGVSIQMAAREMRYRYFEQVRGEHGYDYVATAHHLNDSIETVLNNLIRGTGIDGLTGISTRNGAVIRPLLFSTRHQIQEYALSLALQWRNDASNDTDHYNRNIIRHHVIPLLQSLNPDLENNLKESIERFTGARWLAKQKLETLKAVKSGTDNVLKVAFASVVDCPYPAVVLWEFIKDLGFKYHDCKVIAQQRQPGKFFLSRTHRLTVDRRAWIVTPIEKDAVSDITISIPDVEVRGAHHLLVLSSTDRYTIQSSATIAQLDLDNITFPLVWRAWRPGDFFSPLGMVSRKKISDFLIDNKVPRTEKEQVTVVESGGDIIWVVGFRISERFKVTEQTRRVLKMELRKL